MLATIALGVGSLCTIAVPKLAGDLIDICIHYGQGSLDADAAKHQLNGDADMPACTRVNLAQLCNTDHILAMTHMYQLQACST